ncbi:ROK family protein [Amaricoccus sp.]|uniref:ROK family protein n=1 Tax=Amaricoccus sp. TaxID=1872485 RepID=UPI002B5F14B8|nr:ROK family protein [Amaricoccus sp.]HRW16740.1 ROK family protein [Amaricoccus sp.]
MSDFSSLSSSPRRVRQANVAAALQAIFAGRQLSRADLARQLGLNRSSSGNIISELIGNGLVREVAEDAPKPTRAGRPGILLELVPEGACFIGVEIGVEHITALRIGLTAEVSDVRVVPFDGRHAPVAEAVDRAVAIALEGAASGEIERCEGFGLATPAQMDRRGRVRIAPLLGWRDVDLAAITREALPAGIPSLVENDANAFAIGEAYASRGRQRGVTLVLVIESGVGGGIVIDGQLFRGGNGLAGEIGHIHVPDADCAELEEAIGLELLLNRYRGVATAGDATLAGLLADVRDRAPAAVAIAEDWARHLAFALVQACRLVDPDRIVLGGSVAGLYPMVSARVAFHMETLQADSFPLPEIVLHEAAEMGAAYGAACMLHQRFLSLENDLLAGDAMGKDWGSL